MTGVAGRALPASTLLQRKIELVIEPWASACRRLLAHPRLRDVVPEYFATTHTIIRATVPIMETAAVRARALADDDPVAAGVAAYFEQHAEEEADHDVWLLEDLELMGLDRADVLARVPSQAVAALVGTQYYWVLHYHPVALLGYFALMECYPPSQATIELLIERSGYPPEAFRTLAEHGELDTHHRDELYATIDALPLTAEQESMLGLSAMTAAEYQGRALTEVLDRVG